MLKIDDDLSCDKYVLMCEHDSWWRFYDVGDDYYVVAYNVDDDYDVIVIWCWW